MKSFNQRIRQHDQWAIALVKGRFQDYDFEDFNIGHETDMNNLKIALQGLYDEVSLLLRYRPDKIFIKDGYKPLLVEIKSEYQNRPNFAIEIDSLKAAKEWDLRCNHVLYIFVDLRFHSLKSCWAREIELPKTIFVPDRMEWEQTRERLIVEFPDSKIIVVSHKSGSGTPYFLLPKSTEYLVDINDILINYGENNL